MRHAAIDQVLKRAELAKTDSDFTYFFSLLLAAEALAKTVILGMVAAIAEDKDRNRYRLEHSLARADGLGDWSRAFEDALSGPASQHLLVDARNEQTALVKPFKDGEWQHASVSSLKAAIEHLGIDAEDVPVKTDMKRWFRLFAVLRNKTRAHGAMTPGKASIAAQHLYSSIDLFYRTFSLFDRHWAYLHRNLSGKYRVSPICNTVEPFALMKKDTSFTLPDGIYVFFGAPRLVPLMRSDPELQDFFFANGGFTDKRFELLSYGTDDKAHADATAYNVPPGTLPPSETEGHGELVPCGKCFANTPPLIKDYVSRPRLEHELQTLLLDDKRPIVTLVGRGGIGKTSLALRVIQSLFDGTRYEAIVWLSARDIDLQLTGPKPVRQRVLSPDDMAKLYATLVLSPDATRSKTFNARAFFEQQLQKCDAGRCLFVFDNFETTQNPIDMFNWIDSFVRLPNKALITTRLRDFKGDYPVEVRGMDDGEALTLVKQTAAALDIEELLNRPYIDEVISQSEGHPYVIKILLGEVAKHGCAGNIPRLVAGSDDILTALFERTYAALTPCAQRAFLTLAAWHSLVPRLALEAVLLRSTEARSEVEKGIDSLLQYSMAESQAAPADGQEFIGLPLVANVFGKKKLNISPSRDAVQSDVEILQMLGSSRRDDIRLGLATRLERFIANVSRRVDKGGDADSFAPILEMMCRAYNPGWLLLARWHMEMGTAPGYRKAKEELRRFLENDPAPEDAAEAWRMLGYACCETKDALGEIHALIERAQISCVPFVDISRTANRLNSLLHDHDLEVDREEKCLLAERLLTVLEKRRKEAGPDDFSRMAWLAVHMGQAHRAREYAETGLTVDPDNDHCQKLIGRLSLM